MFKVFWEKVVELYPRHEVFGLGATSMLVSLLDYQSTKKQRNKKDLVGLFGPSGFEMVFILLAKAITVKI